MHIAAPTIHPFVAVGLATTNAPSNLSNDYTLDNWIAGEVNSLAKIAARAVSTNPGIKSFTPLLVRGEKGSGKTHLLQAIGNQIRHGLGKSVIYATGENFYEELMSYTKSNIVTAFVHKYERASVLLIDDLHFFREKTYASELIVQLAMFCKSKGKQFGAATHLTVEEMEEIDRRLPSFFATGTVVKVTAPDYEARVHIVTDMAEAMGLELPEDSLRFIAHNVDSSVEKIREVLHYVSAEMAEHPSKRMVPHNISEIVRHISIGISREIPVETIIKIVCAEFGINPSDTKLKSRKRPRVVARQMSMALAKKYTKQTLKSIGKHFAGKDHSTVIHSMDAIKDLLDTDEDIREKYAECEKQIKKIVG